MAHTREQTETASANYRYDIAEGYFGKKIAKDLLYIRQSAKVAIGSYERPMSLDELSNVEPREMPNLPFAVMVMDGNAGSGKSYSTGSFYQRIGGVVLCGATNAAADNIGKRVENAYAPTHATTIHKEIGIIGKHLSIPHREDAKPLRFFTRDQCTMKEFIRESLYKWWRIVSDIVDNVQANCNTRIRKVCNSHNENTMDQVRDLVLNSFRNKVTRLITSDVIVIDEAGLLCYDILALVVFCWYLYNATYNTPLFHSHIPIVVVVGSTAQTSAIDNNGEVPSILNAIRWPCFRELQDAGWSKCYRFIGQKRCKDEAFNELMTSLEYGKNLTDGQIDLVDTMVRPFDEVSDPRFYPDYVRLFFSHEEVCRYMKRLFALENIVKFNLKHIICLHLDDFNSDIDKWLQQNTASNYSQFADLNREGRAQYMGETKIVHHRGGGGGGGGSGAGWYGDCTIEKEGGKSDDEEETRVGVWQYDVTLVLNGPSIVCYPINVQMIGFRGTVKELVTALQSGQLVNSASNKITCERLLINLGKQLLQFVFNWTRRSFVDENDGKDDDDDNDDDVCDENDGFEGKDDDLLANVCVDSKLLDQLEVALSFNELQPNVGSLAIATHLKLLVDSIVSHVEHKDAGGALSGSSVEFYAPGLDWKIAKYRQDYRKCSWWGRGTPSCTLRTEERVTCLGSVTSPPTGSAFGDRYDYENAALEVGCDLTCPVVQTREGFVGIASAALVPKYITVPDETVRRVRPDATKQLLIAKILDPCIVPFYAMTVKKSQGMTLDKEVLIVPTWANGWFNSRTVYTGISRTSDTSKLYLNRNPFKDDKVIPTQCIKTHLYETVWNSECKLVF